MTSVLSSTNVVNYNFDPQSLDLLKEWRGISLDADRFSYYGSGQQGTRKALNLDKDVEDNKLYTEQLIDPNPSVSLSLRCAAQFVMKHPSSGYKEGTMAAHVWKVLETTPVPELIDDLRTGTCDKKDQPSWLKMIQEMIKEVCTISTSSSSSSASVLNPAKDSSGDS